MMVLLGAQTKVYHIEVVSRAVEMQTLLFTIPSQQLDMDICFFSDRLVQVLYSLGDNQLVSKDSLVNWRKRWKSRRDQSQREMSRWEDEKIGK